MSTLPVESPESGVVTRDEFGARQVEQRAETAASAVAAQAQAVIQARHVVALQRPRDWDDVRAKLLKECKRSSFAAVARYRKPIGKGVEGPSIRFAEAAIRAMGNIAPEVVTVYDDREKRIVRVSLTDLESNVTYSKDVVIEKSVERRKLREGQVPLGSRINSEGERVYLVEATDDDILNKENALVSKAIRTSGLRLLPGDILDECMTVVLETQRKGVAADPDAERKKIADSYAALGVQPSDLKKYLGHDLAQSSPEELLDLRALYAAIRDGEATWVEAMDSRVRAGAEPADSAESTKANALKAKLDVRKAALRTRGA